MEFRYYNERLAKKLKISVDGLVPYSFHLSHYKPNRTLAKYKADTGTEIALKWAKDTSFDREKFPIVTNNHFDTDGVLAVWSALYPEEALLHKDIAVRAAEAGDFCHYTKDDAFQVDAVIEAFRHSPDSPFIASTAGLNEESADGYTYQKLVHMLPDIWLELDKHKALWEKPLRELHRNFDAFKSKEFSVREHWGEWLSVVEGPRLPSPFAVGRFCQGKSYLLVRPGPGGKGTAFDLHYAYYSWADTPYREKVEWVDFAPLADSLNAKDSLEGGRWRTKWPAQEDTAALRFCAESGAEAGSSLSVAEVESAVREHLKTGQKIAAPTAPP